MVAPSVSAMAARGSTKAVASLQINLFRLGDLRLHDNPTLRRTIEASKKASSSSLGVLPIFCFDPRIFGDNARSQFGSLKCGARRAKFVLESVADLRSRLEGINAGLVVAYGKPEDIIEQLLTQIKEKASSPTLRVEAFCQEEVCSEERFVEKQVRSVLQRHNKDSSLETVWGSTLYNLDELPYEDGLEDMPNTFTPFRNKVEKNCKICIPIPPPTRKGDVELPIFFKDVPGTASNKLSLEKCSLTYFPTLTDLGYTKEQIKAASEIDERGVMQFQGGETAALARVKDYIWDKDLLKVYFDTRNGMIGPDYSTKFAPWLAHGCISPRYIAKECHKYEQERVANKSTYWVVFELLWRDFFKFFAMKHGNSIFFPGGTTGTMKKWDSDARRFQAWKEGKTGYPLVDANMRELAASGFMSNRGRQNVCSFLAIDMNFDWRLGGDYFETELLDYDVYSNWGNWCSGAGMTGGRLNRFNIVKQSKDYDQHGEYVRRWLPELAKLPNNLVHEPWKMTQFQQMEYGVRLGVDYPNPLVPPSRQPSSQNGRGGGRRNNENNDNKRRGGGKHNEGRGRDNKNRGRGQRQDMKSLRQGEIRMDSY